MNDPRDQIIVRVPAGMRDEFGRAAMRADYRSRNQAACAALRAFIERQYLAEALDAERLVAAVREEEGALER